MELLFDILYVHAECVYAMKLEIATKNVGHFSGVCP